MEKTLQILHRSGWSNRIAKLIIRCLFYLVIIIVIIKENYLKEFSDHNFHKVQGSF